MAYSKGAQVLGYALDQMRVANLMALQADVSAVNVGLLGHSGFVESRRVLRDIAAQQARAGRTRVLSTPVGGLHTGLRRAVGSPMAGP